MTRRVSFAPNEYYHVFQQGAADEPIFRDEEDRRRFVRLLYVCNTSERVNVRSLGVTTIFEYQRSGQLTDIGAYSLVDTHFHLLLRERIPGGISAFMQKLMTAYTMYFNAKYNRTGRLYDGPYRAIHVGSRKHLKYVFMYIHLKPAARVEPRWREADIRRLKKIKQFLDDYQYSSYPEYRGRDRDESQVLTQDAFPKYFSRRTSFDRILEEWQNIRGETFDSRE